MAAGGAVGGETNSLTSETPLVEVGYFAQERMRSSEWHERAPVGRCGPGFQKTLSMYGALFDYTIAPGLFFGARRPRRPISNTR